tara:strand:+ start:836 stop:1807 length:972 start_codon:yes stop_codon:yes gene_type:complete
MNLVTDILRNLIIYLSFPNNLKKEKLSNLQIKIIDEINARLKNLSNNLDNSENNHKLNTHKIFSESVYYLIKKKKLNNFLRKGFIQKMFFVHNRFYNLKFLKKILDTKSNFWINLLEESNVGNPVPFFSYRKSSGNRIRHVFLIKEIFDYAKIQNVDAVIEIGGGYGCMAKILNEIDKNVNYTIFDLPEVNLLQYYYLKSNGISFAIDNIEEEKIVTSRLDLLYDKVGLLRSKNKKILIIANWSLSEMPLVLRKKLEFLFKNCNYGIISYQSQFEDICNIKYFENFSKKLSKNFLIETNLLEEMNSKFDKIKHFVFLMKKNEY